MNRLVRLGVSFTPLKKTNTNFLKSCFIISSRNFITSKIHLNNNLTDNTIDSRNYEELVREAFNNYLSNYGGEDEYIGEDFFDDLATSDYFKELGLSEYDNELIQEQRDFAEKQGKPFGKEVQGKKLEGEKEDGEVVKSAATIVGSVVGGLMDAATSKDIHKEDKAKKRDMISIIVSKDEYDDMRLDKFLKKVYPTLSHGLMQKLFRKKKILKNGQPVKENSERVFGGDVIEIPKEFLPNETNNDVTCNEEKINNNKDTISLEEDDLEIEPSSEEISNEVYKLLGKPSFTKDGKLILTPEQVKIIRGWIIFRNDEVIVLNKPYGIAVQGGSRHEGFHLDAILEALTGLDGFAVRPKLVHRLDRDTTGVLVVARNRAGVLRMQRWFSEESETLKKCYWAITSGTPSPVTGRVKMVLDIQKDERGYERVYGTEQKSSTSKISITEYKTIDHMTDQLSWLALYPITGRKHQLRVHCSTALHCPIIGDFKYGNGIPEHLEPIIPDISLKRLHLHARALKLPYLDKDGKNIVVVAPLPAHFDELFRYLLFDEKDGNKLLFK
ncbi:hypothetical protein ABK040_010698 [Willaertia magna]